MSAGQERSGPTPAQEALERVMFDAWNDRSRPIGEAVLAAIEAGEVPGVFTADHEYPDECRAFVEVLMEVVSCRLYMGAWHGEPCWRWRPPGMANSLPLDQVGDKAERWGAVLRAAGSLVPVTGAEPSRVPADCPHDTFESDGGEREPSGEDHRHG